LSIDGETINRFGSGEAEITDIRLLDENDKEVDYCKYGNKVRVIYDVSFKAEVEEPIFGMRITDHKQNIVYGTNTRLHRVESSTYKKGDNISIEFTFMINMMGGQYSISPAVGYNDTKTYCDWVNDMIMLNVAHNNIAEGICDLNPVIKINRS